MMVEVCANSRRYAKPARYARRQIQRWPSFSRDEALPPHTGLLRKPEKPVGSARPQGPPRPIGEPNQRELPSPTGAGF